MDELNNFLKTRQAQAVEAVETALLKDAALAKVSSSDRQDQLPACTVAWQTTGHVHNKVWTVYIGLPKFFPDEPPIAKVLGWNHEEHLTPHVGADGVICAITHFAAIDSSDPIGLFRYVVQCTHEILAGTGDADFRAEFSYYWTHQASVNARQVIIVDPIDSLDHSFPAIFCNDYIFVASSAERLNRWISHRVSESSTLKTEDMGVKLTLDAPLIPSLFPKTLADLIEIAHDNDHEAEKRIENHVNTSPGNGLVLLLQREGKGVALGGVVFKGLNLFFSHTKELNKGFRPGRVPLGVLRKRALPFVVRQVVTRNTVQRVDSQWIHSRGGDGRNLSEKSVLLIGCGSLGGYVAHLLSRAGVGRLTITDNDKLKWENLGRHVLGASFVGRWKAEAMAESISQELPHVEVQGIPIDWRDAFLSDEKLLDRHQLIISTVADWRCERPLNNIGRKSTMPPIIFGWLEPYAVAGHCLLTVSKGGCFQCGANSFGQLIDPVAIFKESTLIKEPGGCTHYQNYGPTTLMPVASLIASTAIESLIDTSGNSKLNSWVSDAEHFAKVGASPSPAWSREVQRLGYSRTFNRKWDQSRDCAVCSEN